MEIIQQYLELGLHQDATVLRESHRVITLVWSEGQVPQRWSDAMLKVLT